MAVDNSILDTARREPRPGTIRVCLLAWGATEADQEHAIRRAGQGWGRNAWEFVGTERLIGNVCPLDVRDGRSIAADAGYGWAYIVYAAAACS